MGISNMQNQYQAQASKFSPVGSMVIQATDCVAPLDRPASPSWSHMTLHVGPHVKSHHKVHSRTNTGGQLPAAIRWLLGDYVTAAGVTPGTLPIRASIQSNNMCTDTTLNLPGTTRQLHYSYRVIAHLTHVEPSTA